MLRDPNGTTGISLQNKPPEIRAAQMNPSESAGATYEAWVRQQTIVEEGSVYAIQGGTRVWSGRNWWIPDANFVYVGEPRRRVMKKVPAVVLAMAMALAVHREMVKRREAAILETQGVMMLVEEMVVMAQVAMEETEAVMPPAPVHYHHPHGL